MCELLKVSRANVYKYKDADMKLDPETDRVCRLFRDNRKGYGTRRLKASCQREGVILSRRRIGRIMRENG